MPALTDKNILDAAWRAVDNARQVRAYHRRRTSKTSNQRKVDIEVALERLKTVMKPLKSEIGRHHFAPQTETSEKRYEKFREASDAVQRERRKLWKMQTKPPKES